MAPRIVRFKEHSSSPKPSVEMPRPARGTCGGARSRARSFARPDELVEIIQGAISVVPPSGDRMQPVGALTLSPWLTPRPMRSRTFAWRRRRRTRRSRAPAAGWAELEAGCWRSRISSATPRYLSEPTHVEQHKLFKSSAVPGRLSGPRLTTSTPTQSRVGRRAKAPSHPSSTRPSRSNVSRAESSVKHTPGEPSTRRIALHTSRALPSVISILAARSGHPRQSRKGKQ